jgi:PAS domain S-box-containing protein
MSVDSSLPAGLSPALFQSLAAAAPEGIVICAARSGDWQVVYANPAMEQLTGYEAGALRGRNLKVLQAEDHDQEGLARIRAALQDGTTCPTPIRTGPCFGTR